MDFLNMGGSKNITFQSGKDKVTPNVQSWIASMYLLSPYKLSIDIMRDLSMC